MTTIDRLSHRIKTIADTSFIPAAYAISELAAVGVIILLLFIKTDLKDMDNPFEMGKNTISINRAVSSMQSTVKMTAPS